MCLKIIHPGDGRGGHLSIGSHCPPIRVHPWVLSPLASGMHRYECRKVSLRSFQPQNKEVPKLEAKYCQVKPLGSWLTVCYSELTEAGTGVKSGASI